MIDNPHYHHQNKGCILKPHRLIRNEKEKYVISCQRCITHNKIVCRCGWEFGWHNGEQKSLI